MFFLPRQSRLEDPLPANVFFNTPRRNRAEQRGNRPQTSSLTLKLFVLLLAPAFIFRLIVDSATLICTVHNTFFSGTPELALPLCDSHNRLFSTMPSKDILLRFFMIEDRLISLERNISSIPTLPLRNLADLDVGARVIDQLTYPKHHELGFWSRVLIGRFGIIPLSSIQTRPPKYALKLGLAECWTFEGSTGYLGILLAEESRISMLSLDYAHPDHVSSALLTKSPRKVALWALLPSSSLPPSTPARPLADFFKVVNPPFSNYNLTGHFVLVTTGIFDPALSATRQYFPTPFPVDITSRVVVLEVLDNWGADSTCVSYIGIYGEMFAI